MPQFAPPRPPAPSSSRNVRRTAPWAAGLVACASITVASAQWVPDSDSSLLLVLRSFAPEVAAVVPTWAQRVYGFLVDASREARAPRAAPSLAAPSPEARAPRPPRLVHAIEHVEPYALPVAELAPVAPPPTSARARPTLDLDDPYGMFGGDVAVSLAPAAPSIVRGGAPAPAESSGRARIESDNPYL
jgi:hypothetical protein